MIAKMDKTAEVLQEMFTENTGVALCDSGGDPQYDENGNYIGSSSGYGRNFERNQGVNLDEGPQATVEFRTWGENNIDIDFETSTYHFLKENLTFDEELDEFFHGQFLEEYDSDDKCWLELMQEFPTSLCDNPPEDCHYYDFSYVGGFYGEGDPFVVNVYNEENLLDQVIQFVYFTSADKTEFCVLQVHGGCDVRGGYTKPRVFTVDEELSIFDYKRGSIVCSGKDHHKTALLLKDFQEKQLPLRGFSNTSDIDFDNYHEHVWSTDDGYDFRHIHGNDSLKDYEVKVLSSKDDEDDVWEEGKLCIKDGVGYCPFCGAKLEASMM